MTGVGVRRRRDVPKFDCLTRELPEAGINGFMVSGEQTGNEGAEATGQRKTKGGEDVTTWLSLRETTPPTHTTAVSISKQKHEIQTPHRFCAVPVADAKKRGLGELEPP